MSVSGQPSRTVAVVIGTGAMAPEIAVACASAGMTTRIVGRNAERAAAAVQWASSFVTDGAISAGTIDAAGVADADVVFETIVEDADAKRTLLGQVEAWCGPETIIVTNTSSLTIAELARDLARPDYFAGFHFLKPAHLTGVVEVIPGPKTGAEVVVELRMLAERMGKVPLTVRRDVPGFIWNRIQFAVLRECLYMLDEGVADADDIDAAVSDGLAPRWVAAGPLATADLGGLDTFRRVSEQLFPHLAADTQVSASLRDRAAEGGRFQEWTAGDAAAVSALREAALEAGRRVAAHRRELAP